MSDIHILDIITQLMLHLEFNEARFEKIEKQVSDLERQDVKNTSEMAALRREVKGMREWL